MLLLPASCILFIVNYKPFCHTRTLTVLSLSYSSFLTSSIRYLFFFLPLFLSLSFVTLLPTCHPLHFPFFYLPPFLFLPSYFIYLPLHSSAFARSHCLPAPRRADSSRRRHCAGWHWRTYVKRFRPSLAPRAPRPWPSQPPACLLLVIDGPPSLHSFILRPARLFLNTATWPSLNYLVSERIVQTPLWKHTTPKRQSEHYKHPRTEWRASRSGRFTYRQQPPVPIGYLA